MGRRNDTRAKSSGRRAGGHDGASGGAAAGVLAGRADLLVCVALAVVSFLLYARSLSFDFVALDDNAYVTENATVQRGLSPATVWWAFTTTEFANWLPVTWLSHLADVSMFGLNAGGHHATSAAIHALNAVLLFVLLMRWTGRRWPAAWAAALFAVHPLRVESVAWIAERKDVLAATFFLLTLLAYTRYARGPSAARLILVCVAFALGLMSKTMIVTLPFLLLLLDWWPLRRPWAGRIVPLPDEPMDDRDATDLPPAPPSGSVRAGLLEKVPLLVLALIACGWTVVLQREGGALEMGQSLTMGQRVANAFVSVPRYIGKTIAPADLAVLYPHPRDWPASYVAASVAFVFGVTVLAWMTRRRRPYVLVGWLWFLGMLVPVSGVVQAGLQSMADRYTYLPGMGLLIAAVWAIDDVVARHGRRGRQLATAAAAAACVALCVLTLRQVETWRNTVTLFVQAVSATRDNGMAHRYIATELTRPDAFDEGGTHRQAGLAREAAAQQAEAHLHEALRIDPGDVYAHFNLGNLRLRTAGPAVAIPHYREAIRRGMNNAAVHESLGAALAMSGDFAAAEAEFRRAVDRARLPRTLVNLGNAVRNQGRLAEALTYYEQALAIDPNDPRARRAVAELTGAAR